MITFDLIEISSSFCLPLVPVEYETTNLHDNLIQHSNVQSKCATRFRAKRPLFSKEPTPLNEKETNENSGTVEVQFKASTSACIEQLSPPPNGKNLIDFFSCEGNRDLLMSEKAKVSKIENPSKLQIKLFERAASKLPLENANFLEIVNPTISFPGLKVKSIVIFGTQTIVGEYPEYQFSLLDSRLEANGPRPLVWLFNKLTKSKKTENDGDLPRQTTFSQSRIWVEPSEDKKDGITLRSKAKLEAHIKIPSFMLRILPVSLEKLEQQGCNGLQSALDDVEPGLQRLGKSYLKWSAG